jgi:ABC-type Na+ efflux pump permease subunit
MQRSFEQLLAFCSHDPHMMLTNVFLFFFVFFFSIVFFFFLSVVMFNGLIGRDEKSSDEVSNAE